MQRAILAESQSIYPLLETPAFTENVIRYVFHSAEEVPRKKTSPDAMAGSPLLRKCHHEILHHCAKGNPFSKAKCVHFNL